MLDILILYSLNKQEKTFYGLAKTIAEYFGSVSKPSHGALHPAVKKLTKDGLLSIRKKMSDGGKRYTYYTVSKDFQKGFNEKFLTFNYSKWETTDSFLLDLKVRLFTFDLLEKPYVEEFKEKALLKLDSYEKEINETIENRYIELTDLQKNIPLIYLKEINEYRKIIKNLD